MLRFYVTPSLLFVLRWISSPQDHSRCKIAYWFDYVRLWQDPEGFSHIITKAAKFNKSKGRDISSVNSFSLCHLIKNVQLIFAINQIRHFFDSSFLFDYLQMRLRGFSIEITHCTHKRIHINFIFAHLCRWMRSLDEVSHWAERITLKRSK